MDQVEFLSAVKKEIKEKAELDNAKLIGRREGYAEGKQEGKQEGLYKAIKGLMKNLKISITTAMEMLSVPKKEYDIYIEMDENSREDN